MTNVNNYLKENPTTHIGILVGSLVTSIAFTIWATYKRDKALMEGVARVVGPIALKTKQGA